MNSTAHVMSGSHDSLFVALSLIIATVASYAALDLAGRVRSAEGSTRYGWLIGGATVMGLGIWSMHFVAMLAFRLRTGGLGAAGVAAALVILILALAGAVIDRIIQSKVELTRQLTAMNAELQRSLDDAERARRALTEEHAAYSQLQWLAQQEAVKAKWLEGVSETTTALAHELNNPLTALLMNVEQLEQAEPNQAEESIAEIRNAARRIAAAIKRMAGVNHPRSVAYIGKTRMIDLSSDEPK